MMGCHVCTQRAGYSFRINEEKVVVLVVAPEAAALRMVGVMYACNSVSAKDWSCGM